MNKAAVKRAILTVIEKNELVGSSEYYNFVAEMVVLHASKNADYSANSEYSGLDNFIKTAASLGKSVREIFRVNQAQKRERYNSLVDAAVEPNHESLSDTLIDMAVYCGLEAAFMAKFPGLIDTPLTGIPTYVNENNLADFFPKG